MKDGRVAYLMARLIIAMSFFGHGIVRMPKINAFASGMVESFNKTFLPGPVVSAFGHILPVLELCTGILLLLGCFTRIALCMGVSIMLALIFGSCLTEKFDAVFIQIGYGGYLAVLYYFLQYNSISIDHLRKQEYRSVI